MVFVGHFFKMLSFKKLTTKKYTLTFKKQLKHEKRKSMVKQMLYFLPTKEQKHDIFKKNSKD